METVTDLRVIQKLITLTIGDFQTLYLIPMFSNKISWTNTLCESLVNESFWLLSPSSRIWRIYFPAKHIVVSSKLPSQLECPRWIKLLLPSPFISSIWFELCHHSYLKVFYLPYHPLIWNFYFSTYWIDNTFKDVRIGEYC